MDSLRSYQTSIRETRKVQVVVKFLRKLFGESQNFEDEASATPKKKFNPKQRIDAEKDSEKDKMDKGFNGKTYTINGIEYDF